MNITAAFDARQPKQPIIIGDDQRRGNWTKSSGWRRNGW
jgi:hypothetical protein